MADPSSGIPLIRFGNHHGSQRAPFVLESFLGYTPQVLVIEDEPAVRTMLSRVFREDGYVVTAVGSARQAFWLLREVGFEVVILDMSLPDADGMDVLRQIRLETPYIHILVLSGMMVGGLATVARAAGADAMLAKPATARSLREAVYGLLDLGLRPVERRPTVSNSAFVHQ